MKCRVISCLSVNLWYNKSNKKICISTGRGAEQMSIKARNQWNKRHYKTVAVMLREGDRERLAAVAGSGSVSDYIAAAVNARAGREVLAIRCGSRQRDLDGRQQRLTIAIDLDRVDDLARLAAAEGKSLSCFLRDCVNAYAGEVIITTGRQGRPLKKALSDPDGRQS